MEKTLFDSIEEVVETTKVIDFKIKEIIAEFYEGGLENRYLDKFGDVVYTFSNGNELKLTVEMNTDVVGLVFLDDFGYDDTITFNKTDEFVTELTLRNTIYYVMTYTD